MTELCQHIPDYRSEVGRDIVGKRPFCRSQKFVGRGLEGDQVIHVATRSLVGGCVKFEENLVKPTDIPDDQAGTLGAGF